MLVPGRRNRRSPAKLWKHRLRCSVRSCFFAVSFVGSLPSKSELAARCDRSCDGSGSKRTAARSGSPTVSATQGQSIYAAAPLASCRQEQEHRSASTSRKTHELSTGKILGDQLSSLRLVYN